MPFLFIVLVQYSAKALANIKLLAGAQINKGISTYLVNQTS